MNLSQWRYNEKRKIFFHFLKKHLSLQRRNNHGRNTGRCSQVQRFYEGLWGAHRLFGKNTTCRIFKAFFEKLNNNELITETIHAILTNSFFKAQIEAIDAFIMHPIQTYIVFSLIRIVRLFMLRMSWKFQNMILEENFCVLFTNQDLMICLYRILLMPETISSSPFFSPSPIKTCIYPWQTNFYPPLCSWILRYYAENQCISWYRWSFTKGYYKWYKWRIIIYSAILCWKWCTCWCLECRHYERNTDEWILLNSVN